jgi:rubrerythrin
MHDVTLTRRGALRAGGVALVGAGVLAACSSDSDPIAVTGTTGPDQTTTTLPLAGEDDLVFLRTAVSLELSAVDFYDQVLEGERAPGADLREVATLFKAHHQQHADLLDRVIGEEGGEAVEEPNEVYSAELVDAPLEAATTDEAVLEAARALELVAADAYVSGAGTLTKATLRQKAMEVGGSDARHITYLDILLEAPELVPEAFAVAEPFQDDALLPPGEQTDPAEDEGEAEGETTETTAAEDAGGSTTTTTAADGETTTTTAEG